MKSFSSSASVIGFSPYGQIGDVFAWLCLATALGLCGFGALRPVRRIDSRANTPSREASR